MWLLPVNQTGKFVAHTAFEPRISRTNTRQDTRSRERSLCWVSRRLVKECLDYPTGFKQAQKEATYCERLVALDKALESLFNTKGTQRRAEQ